MIRLPICVLLGCLVFAMAHGAEREMVRRFPVQPGAALVIDTYRGDIVVEEGDPEVVEVRINFDYDVETEAEAEELWAGLRFEMGKSGKTVGVTVRNERAMGPRLLLRESTGMNLYYTVRVPPRCDLTLTTGPGNVTVGRLAGRMYARTGEGTIFFRHVEGDITAATDRGDVVISRCTGQVNAQVRNGMIRAGTLSGGADLRSHNGSIEVMMARGALTVAAEVGDAIVNFPRDITQSSSITSSGGDVQVSIDPAANCEVEAVSTWGRVKSELELKTTRVKTRRLEGRLNEGGARLTLRANGGSVRIKPGETLFE